MTTSSPLCYVKHGRNGKSRCAPECLKLVIAASDTPEDDRGLISAPARGVKRKFPATEMIHRHMNSSLSPSESQVILVLASATCCDPQHDCGEHEGDVLGDICVAIVGELLRVLFQNVLQNQHSLQATSARTFGKKSKFTHDAPSQSASHQGKPNEQEQPRPPNSPRVSKPFLTSHTILVDEDYHKKSEQRTYSWNPIDESDMNRWGRIQRFLCMRRKDSGVQESPVRQRKLENISSANAPF